MNDHELELGLRSIHRDLPGAERGSGLHAWVRGLRFDDIPQRRGILPRWDLARPRSMFSATKFVVAGVIVALFGGVLLAWVLSRPTDDPALVGATATGSLVASASPEAHTQDLPALALETEEVAPGVSLVTGDGVDGHDFPREPSRWKGFPDVIALDDGSVWLTLEDQPLFELGVPPASDRAPGPTEPGVGQLALDAEGTLWLLRGGVAEDDGALMAFQDGHWVERGGKLRRSVYGRDPSRRPQEIGGMAFHPDGSLWVVANGKSPPRADGVHEVVSVDQRGPEGWTSYQGGDELACPECEGLLEITPDGTVWVGLHDTSGSGTSPGPDRSGGLRRFDGDRWEVVRPPGIGDDLNVVALEVNEDGVLWVQFRRNGSDWRRPGHVLARLDDDGWAVFDQLEPGIAYLHTVDAAGRAWLTFQEGLFQEREAEGYPVAFDGSTLTRFDELAAESIPGWLRGYKRIDIDASPDGTVWVTSAGRLFRITEPGLP